VGAGGGGVLAGGQARLGPGGPLRGVDLQRFHSGQVEDDAAVGGAVAGVAVPAAADGQLEPVVAGHGDDPADLGGVGGADDRRRSELLEPAVEQGPGLVVARIVGRDHGAAEAVAQLHERSFPF
jgi:hypothetical protein